MYATTKVPKDCFYVNFLDNGIMSIGSDPSQEGLDVSPINDMK